MSKFVIEKAVEKTRFVLEKKKVKDIKAHIVVDLDVSGSTADMYHQGLFQKAFQQVLPIGILFDDNQEIDTFTFSSSDDSVTHIKPNATAKNYETYIKNNILDAPIPKWNGTDYLPVLKANVAEFGFYREESSIKKSFFGLFSRKSTTETLRSDSSTGYPVIVFFFTDGENNDQRATMEYLQSCQDNNVNIYFQFIGIGTGKFGFLKAVADKFTNTGFVHMQDFDKLVDDDAFIDTLLSDELCGYLKTK